MKKAMPNEQTIKIVTFLFLIQVILKMDLFNYTWMHCYGKQMHPYVNIKTYKCDGITMKTIYRFKRYHVSLSYSCEKSKSKF